MPGFLIFATAATLALATQASAQPVAATTQATTTVDVTLADFSFKPSALSFEKGRHYRLHLDNRGSGGHNFAAPQFLAAVSIDAADQPLIKKGKIEVPKGGSVTIGFTPVTPGSYKIKCTHFLHSGFGMKGTATIN